MRRRDALMLLGLPVVVACGGGASPSAGNPPPVDLAGEVGTNHGHVAVVTAQQLLLGDAVRLDIRGSTRSHTHTVDLSADEVRRIRAGQRVAIESSADYEDKQGHTVTFNP